MDRAEKVIRSTDYDALSCRVSATKKGYLLNDQYLPNLLQGLERFLKFEYKLSANRTYNAIANSNKLPIINRGTYIRTKSIDFIVEAFITKFKSQTKLRIINLGAGSDTRAFRILQKDPNDQIEVIEFDFAKSTKLKHAIIKSDPILSKIIGVENVNPTDDDQFYGKLDPSLVSNRYKLYPIDLRNVEEFQTILQSIDSQTPTLIISECMLCYTESKISNQLIQVLHNKFEVGALVIYDPIGGSDNFGNVMVDNLNNRNIQMPSLMEFNTLEKYTQRLKDIGLPNVKSDDMFNVLNNWIDEKEKQRIARMEFLDEIEELRLLLQHYCIFLGYWGFDWQDIQLKFRKQ